MLRVLWEQILERYLEVKLALKCRKEVKKRAIHFCNYGVVNKNNYKIQNAQVCYANLNYERDVGLSPPFLYFVDYPFKNLKEEKHTLPYIHWVVNNSFWAPAFETKNAKDVFENGAIFNNKFPAQFVICAAIALRYLDEVPFLPFMWLKAQAYYEPHSAFIYAHLCSKCGSRYYIEGYQVSNSNHMIFKKWDIKEELIKLLQEKDYSFCFKNELVSFKDSTKYRRWHRLYEKNLDTYQEYVKPHFKVNEDKKKIKLDSWGNPIYETRLLLSEIKENVKSFLTLNEWNNIHV